jgi:valyl-tRNA synthetase
MSSSQDVRYSEAKVQQGRDLANKLWNASRLVLTGVAAVEPQPRTARVEDRWILSRLQRAIEAIGSDLDRYDFTHAALELYRFVWSEFCDWYLEIVKPRLYDGEEDASATLLHVLRDLLALAHPLMPFVSEEVYSYLRQAAAPGVEPEMLVAHPFPEPDAALLDPEAEREVGEAIELTRDLRRWRDMVGVKAGSVLPARSAEGPPLELVSRLARFSFDGAGDEPIATVGPIEVLASGELDGEQVRLRTDERRQILRSEVDRAERKLANEGFVAKAPPDVVEAEREKLAAYRSELESLG